MKPISLQEKGLVGEELKKENLLPNGACTIYSFITASALLYPEISKENLHNILRILSDPNTYTNSIIVEHMNENRLPLLFDFQKNRSYFDKWILHSEKSRDFTYSLIGNLFSSFNIDLLFHYTNTDDLKKDFIDNPDEHTVIILALETEVEDVRRGHNSTLFYNEGKFYITDLNLPDPLEIQKEDLDKLCSGLILNIFDTNIRLQNQPHHFIKRR